MSKIYEALKRAERERERTAQPGDLARPSGAASGNELDTAEEFRRLRASLVVSSGVTELHTILLTAARHGEGTTRVALGLASALAAEQGTRVLLVEANLRSPSVARLLQLNASPGLSEFLAGEVSAEEMVVRSDASNLSVVHAGGKATPVDCEAIGTGLARLQPQFDFVVIDAPPVNRYADTCMLAPKSDGVILVVEADETPVADAETAKRNLDRVGARILGVVLNRRRVYVPPFLQSLL